MGSKNLENISTVVFDFDGVLSHDKFYGEKLKSEYPATHAWIQNNIFGDDRKLVDDWKRGKLTSEDINKIVSDNTNVEYATLNELHIQGVLDMQLDLQLVDLIKALKAQGYKTCLVTDNMDVFTNITIKNHSLDKLFDVIVNSADHGYLKQDSEGRLYDIAFKEIGVGIKKSLLIDDSPKVVELYRKKDGKAFLFKNFDGLELFLKDNKI